MSTQTDFTPSGTKIEGQYENDRNAESAELIKEIIREAFPGVKDVIVAHHIVYVTEEKRDGFTYQIVEEIPSLDTLIFDHEIAKKLWGEDDYLDTLRDFAIMSCFDRDATLKDHWEARKEWKSHTQKTTP